LNFLKVLETHEHVLMDDGEVMVVMGDGRDVI
jgi:hypothetical protein